MLLDVVGHLVLVGLEVVGKRRSPRRGLATRKKLGKKLFWLYELIMEQGKINLPGGDTNNVSME